MGRPLRALLDGAARRRASGCLTRGGAGGASHRPEPRQNRFLEAQAVQALLGGAALGLALGLALGIALGALVGVVGDDADLRRERAVDSGAGRESLAAILPRRAIAPRTAPAATAALLVAAPARRTPATARSALTAAPRARGLARGQARAAGHEGRT